MKIFHQQTEMKFKVRTSKVLRWEHTIHGTEIWAVRKEMRNNLKCFKCAAENDDQADRSRVK